MIEIVLDIRVLNFLREYRKYAKAFKKVASVSKIVDAAEQAVKIAETVVHEVKDQATADTLNEIVRNSMAYAWEIGHGAPFKFELDASPDNPFLNGDWAAKVDG